MDWWEKTVEYLFVKNFFDYDAVVAPLDGYHERIGDAIFSDNSKFILIEFKRTEAEIKSEVDKYIDYEQAKEELQNKDQHHLIIYGRLDKKLMLECVTYFSNIKSDNIKDSIKQGVDFKTLSTYAEILLKYKKPPKGGGGHGLTLEDYMQVACISNDGNLMCCMSFGDFLHMSEIDEKAQDELEAEA